VKKLARNLRFLPIAICTALLMWARVVPADDGTFENVNVNSNLVVNGAATVNGTLFATSIMGYGSGGVSPSITIAGGDAYKLGDGGANGGDVVITSGKGNSDFDVGDIYITGAGGSAGVVIEAEVSIYRVVFLISTRPLEMSYSRIVAQRPERAKLNSEAPTERRASTSSRTVL